MSNDSKSSEDDAAPSQLLTDKKLGDFGLPEPLERALADNGLTHATPIQAQTLPLAFDGADIAGQAQTGTGKTAAFLLATITRLLTQPPRPATDVPKHAAQPRAIVIAPTRELAEQIYSDAKLLAAHTDLALAVCYGGTGYQEQRERVAAGVDILIGTPGRLIDYYKQKVYTLAAIEVVILDEADRMFDLGFIRDIRYMFRKMPAPTARQSMLFSATLSHRVLELAYEHMNIPTAIRTDDETVNVDAIEQHVYHVSKDDKISLLIGTLRAIDPRRTLIFINTKRVGERVTDYLVANGLQAAILSGDVAQNKRTRLLADFKEGRLDILVATDVAARGLHIPDVSHVINFDLPQDPQDYVHRIGRTARAGNTGTAISLVCEEYVYSLPDIEAYMEHKLAAEVPADDHFATDLTRPAARRRRDGDNRRRRSRNSGGPRQKNTGSR